MKKQLLSVSAAAFAACALVLTANAEWAKSYDWPDSKDQTWEAHKYNSKDCIGNGDWEIQYVVVAGNDIRPAWIQKDGTGSLINFDTVERDTGLRVVALGNSEMMKGKKVLTDVIFPSSLTNVMKSTFHTTGLACDIVFPSKDPVTVGNSAFYGTGIKSVTLTAPGSQVQDSAFSGFDTWTGTSDLRGVTYLGNSALSRGNSNYPTFTVILSPTITYIGNSAFSQQRGMTLEYRYTLAELNSVSAEINGTIGSTAFKDVGASTAKFTLDIPFRGPCTVGSQAFNWMANCTNFFFWGKAPAFANDTFNTIGSGNSYKVCITGDVDMDPDGWAALATACTDTEKGRADYPGDDVCFGTYTGNGGCVFWMCKGKSPYNADISTPVLEEVFLERTAEGCHVTGSLVQGKGALTVSFGDTVVTLLGGVTQTAPYALDVTIPVGEGGAPENWMGKVQVKATDGDKVSAITIDEPFYTGAVFVECERNASEARLRLGAFRVFRSSAATQYPLMVYYSTSGSAVAGKNYVALSGVVEIPAGEDSVVIEVKPLFDSSVTEDTELCLSIQNRSNYLRDSESGSATMMIENTNEDVWDIYVDSNADAGGDGSREFPYRTIREGVAAALPNRAVYVKGGPDRTYWMNEDSDQILVPAEKPGLTICNDGPEDALFRVKDTYSKDDGFPNQGGQILAPFKIEAKSVTLRGFRFEFGKNALGQSDYSYAPVIWSTAADTVIEECTIRQMAEGDRFSSCQNVGYLRLEGGSPIVRNCILDTLYSNNASFQAPVAVVGSSGVTFEGCFITNISRLVRNSVNNSKVDVVVISNRFVNCPSFEACSYTGDPTGGIIGGGYTGILKLTCVYNVFYNDPSMADVSKTVLQRGRSSFQGGLVAHHNTVIGFDNFYCMTYAEGPGPKAEVFDNIFLMNSDALIYNEQWEYKGTEHSNVPTSFAAESFFRNNYVNCTINGGTLKDYSGYDFASHTTVENNITDGTPVFESLDPASPKFCLMKQSKNPTLVGKNIAWTNDGEYPDYIGAIEPSVSKGLMVYLR